MAGYGYFYLTDSCVNTGSMQCVPCFNDDLV